MAATSQSSPGPLQSVVAGGVAGGVEALITYPTEYLKTRQQLGGPKLTSMSPFRILTTTLRAQGVSALYAGAGGYCISNASKSGVRFLTFDLVRNAISRNPADGKPTATANMLAGVMAGVAEGVTVVTPGENLKTKIVDDQAGARRFSSATHALRSIITADGLRGLYRGVWPVTLKQGSNSLVRFTIYHTILEAIQPLMQKRGGSSFAPAAAGAMAGMITVYVTMPFDNVKTRMQSLEGRALFKSTRHCFSTIYYQSGLKAFWKGTTPRLVRLSMSGALSFSIYSKMLDLMDGQHSFGQRMRATD